MAQLTHPFSYKAGGVVKTLLGDTISGNGAVLQRPELHGRLVLMDQNRTVSIRSAKPTVWQEYEDHLATKFSGTEVRRHINKVIAGGAPVYAAKRGNQIVCDVGVNKAVYRAGPSHLKIMAQRAWINLQTPLSGETPGAMSQFVDYFKGVVENSGIVDGDIETIATFTTANNDPLYHINGGNMYTPLMYPRFYNNHGSSWSDRTSVETALSHYRIGYTVLAVSLDGSEAVGGINGTQQVVLLRFKHHPDYPYSWIGAKLTYALSGSDIYAGMNFQADYWSTVVDASVTVPAAVPGELSYGTGDYAKMWKKVLNGAWWLPTASADIGTLVATSPTYIPTPTRGFGITYSASYHFIPGAANGVNWSARGYGVAPFKSDELPVSSTDAPGWPLLSSGDVALRQCAVGILEKGFGGILLGYDMSSTPLAQLRYVVDGPLPSPLPIADCEPTPILTGLLGRWRSADLIIAIESIELQAGADLSSLKAEMIANPRIFMSYYSHGGFRIPYNVIYQTEPAILADEEGFKIDGEVFLEKDQDDPNSKAYTFSQANAECNKWYGTGVHRAIVLPGPTLAFAPPALTTDWRYVLYAGKLQATRTQIIDSVLTDIRPLTLDEMGQVYVGLQEGGLPRQSGVTTSAEYLAFAEGKIFNGYPIVYDFVCQQMYGKNYGEITTARTAGAMSRDWSVDGNLSRGFLAEPVTWTPEFWAITGTGKSYRAAGVVGSLMTNPFGFGTIGNMGHTNG